MPEGRVPGRSRTGGAVGDVEEDRVAPGGEESTGLGGARVAQGGATKRRSSSVTRSPTQAAPVSSRTRRAARTPIGQSCTQHSTTPVAGDSLCVWKLDRFARSLIDLVSMVDTLRERDIGFKVLTGALANIDPGTADGRLMLQVVGAMAEFERSLIKERTRAGLDTARAQGRTGGRPSVMNDDMLTVARARRAKGERANAIARALGVSRATLYRHIGEGA